MASTSAWPALRAAWPGAGAAMWRLTRRRGKLRARVAVMTAPPTVVAAGLLDVLDPPLPPAKSVAAAGLRRVTPWSWLRSWPRCQAVDYVLSAQGRGGLRQNPDRRPQLSHRRGQGLGGRRLRPPQHARPSWTRCSSPFCRGTAEGRLRLDRVRAAGLLGRDQWSMGGYRPPREPGTPPGGAPAPASWPRALFLAGEATDGGGGREGRYPRHSTAAAARPPRFRRRRWPLC